MQGAIRIQDIPDMAGRYVSYNYFEKTYTPFDETASLPLSLAKDAVCLYHFYPVEKDGTVLLGNTEKYAGIAFPEMRKVSLSELISER